MQQGDRNRRELRVERRKGKLGLFTIGVAHRPVISSEETLPPPLAHIPIRGTAPPLQGLTSM